MTNETCVVIVRTQKKAETSRSDDLRRYRAFYVYGPDGEVSYSGGSYRSARMDCELLWPNFPVVEAYRFQGPITGVLDHHPHSVPIIEDAWEELSAYTSAERCDQFPIL